MFNLFDIFTGRKSFGTYSSVKQHIPDSTIIVNMLAFNADLSMKVFLLDIDRGHFSSKVLSLYSNSRKEISERTLFRRSHTTLHHCCIEAKQCLVSFCPYYSKALGVDTSFI